MIIAATPGYYFVETDLEEEMTPVPVIAWRIADDAEAYAEPQPITLDGELRVINGYAWAIRAPDGRVYEPGGNTWSTREEWLPAARRMLERLAA